MLKSLFSSEIREKLLTQLFSHTDQSSYVRELLNDQIVEAEEHLQREINYISYEPQEFQEKIHNKDGFSMDILTGEKIVLIGCVEKGTISVMNPTVPFRTHKQNSQSRTLKNW